VAERATLRSNLSRWGERGMAAHAGARQASSAAAAASGEFRFGRRRPALILGASGILLGFIGPYYLAARGIQEAGDVAVVTAMCLLWVLWGLLAYHFLKAGQLVLGPEDLTIRRGFSRLRLPWSSVESIDRLLVTPEQEEIRESRAGAGTGAGAGAGGFDETMGLPGRGWSLVYELRVRNASDIARAGWFNPFWGRSVVRIQPRSVTEPAALIAALEARRLALQPWRARGAAAPEPMQTEPMPTKAVPVEPPMALGEARDLVARFEPVRRVYRGRLAAPVTELPADPVTMTRALLTVAATVDATRQRRTAEALVDLVAFIDPADADLLDADGRRSPADAERATALLDAMRVARASVIQQIRQDASLVGDFSMLGDRPTHIGEARAALERVREGREVQATAMLATPVVLLVTAVAYAAGSWWWLAFAVGCVAAGLGAAGMARVASWLDRALTPLEGEGRPVTRRRINLVRELLVLVGGLLITLVAMAVVIGATG
jgi:hypothetical protein